MKRAIYAGTFDPITNGHVDVLKKAAELFDEVILAVADHTGKDTIFDLDKRVELCKKSVLDMPKIKVMKFHGLVVNFAKRVKADAMIRGLRAVSDFEYELSQALMNKKMYQDIDTVFFVPSYRYLYLSSTIIREVHSLGGDVTDLIPNCVDEELKELRKNKEKNNG
ncbi:MAG: pantetheine-phosphate adenylyltransferase [Candidatus Cloacimonetes bacterium]|nr:pantetheine-phosphate adenylyltransferase [Candidatus Cloacimonadota bacterium]MCF7814392.1 pantetheine-phosphate adenylyltransferase [Candidatus Cloacimonadota bacterium]MCF7868528.1 pantetheine-phosphate adenylyltransferase [Candidatus Cloacimonadota bacterium]MCF7884052.1 pantetheine-phosphate adenylyltransferase [Candidatus Cloacimonadota bacterium]